VAGAVVGAGAGGSGLGSHGNWATFICDSLCCHVWYPRVSNALRHSLPGSGLAWGRGGVCGMLITRGPHVIRATQPNRKRRLSDWAWFTAAGRALKKGPKSAWSPTQSSCSPPPLGLGARGSYPRETRHLSRLSAGATNARSKNDSFAEKGASRSASGNGFRNLSD
jgi:hypothetical protein